MLAAGFPLQAGQVEQTFRSLLLRLLGLFDCSSLSLAASNDGVSFFLNPDPFCPLVRIRLVLFKVLFKPTAGVLALLHAECGMNFPVVAWNECANCLFSLREDCQGGSLDAASGGHVETAVA